MGGQREEIPRFSSHSGMMGRGGERSGEKRLNNSDHLEKPREGTFFTAGV